MYCPKCGSQTLDEAKFCRGCGADVSLVPMAITGQLTPVSMPAPPSRDIQRSQARAITNTMTGFGFLVVAFSALIFAPAGHLWWFWMLIPAFGSLGAGVAQYLQIRRFEKGRIAFSGGMPNQVTSAPANYGLPGREPEYANVESRYKTGDLVPPSVTDNTTRHLDVVDQEGQTRPLAKNE